MAITDKMYKTIYNRPCPRVGQLLFLLQQLYKFAGDLMPKPMPWHNYSLHNTRRVKLLNN